MREKHTLLKGARGRVDAERHGQACFGLALGLGWGSAW